MDATRNAALTRDQRLVEGVVANLPLFWGVPAAKLAALTKRCWALPAPRGSTLVERGTRLPGILALAYGSVKLVLRKRDRVERVLRIIAARQTFGEPLALLGRSSPYDAIAMQESKLVVIPTMSVVTLLDCDLQFARRLVNALAERNLQLHAELEAATLLNGTQRLASYLTELAGNGGSPQRTVRLPFSKTLVASRLGLKKETLSRLLRDLVEQRVIEMARRDIAILEPGRLGELAREESEPLQTA